MERFGNPCLRPAESDHRHYHPGMTTVEEGSFHVVKHLCYQLICLRIPVSLFIVKHFERLFLKNSIISSTATLPGVHEHKIPTEGLLLSLQKSYYIMTLRGALGFLYSRHILIQCFLQLIHWLTWWPAMTLSENMPSQKRSKNCTKNVIIISENYQQV